MKSFLFPLSLAFVLTAIPAPAADLRPDEIVTVLPKDAIPAILKPRFGDAKSAVWLSARDLVVGVEISGDSRAYPVAILSQHEIVTIR
jgi:Protein of unknown function (DUF3179)